MYSFYFFPRESKCGTKARCPETSSARKGVPELVLTGKVSQNLFQLEGCPGTCSDWKGVSELVLTGKVSQNMEGCPGTCSAGRVSWNMFRPDP
jgi:hypothetical protein